MIKGMEEYKLRVGKELRIHSVFNERADAQAIDRFCDGIGEGNPLFRDDLHVGGRIAPPSFILSVFPGWVLQGLPGMHAFHTSTDFTFYRSIPVNAVIRPKSRFTGYRAFPGKLGAENLLETQEAGWYDADGLPFATATVTGIRAARADARTAAIYKNAVLPHPWTLAELDALEQQILSEKPRGVKPLYAADVNVGDTLPLLTKGPLGLTDILAYCIGACPVHLKAHGLALMEFQKHPAWAFRDPDGHTMEPMFSVHYSMAAANAAGMPYPFDIGCQRHAWLVQFLTNWMGDSGFLCRCQAKYTGFVFLSDVVTFSAVVTAVRGATVTLKTKAVNQRNECVLHGRSEVVLSTKEGLPCA